MPNATAFDYGWPFYVRTVKDCDLSKPWLVSYRSKCRMFGLLEGVRKLPSRPLNSFVDGYLVVCYNSKLGVLFVQLFETERHRLRWRMHLPLLQMVHQNLAGVILAWMPISIWGRGMLPQPPRSKRIAHPFWGSWLGLPRFEHNIYNFIRQKLTVMRDELPIVSC